MLDCCSMSIVFCDEWPARYGRVARTVFNALCATGCSPEAALDFLDREATRLIDMHTFHVTAPHDCAASVTPDVFHLAINYDGLCRDLALAADQFESHSHLPLAGAF